MPNEHPLKSDQLFHAFEVIETRPYRRLSSYQLFERCAKASYSAVGTFG